MQNEAVKLELIKWLTDLADFELIDHLKAIKDAQLSDNDWWNELTRGQKESINQSLKEIDQGKTISHKDVAKKYGL